MSALISSTEVNDAINAKPAEVGANDAPEDESPEPETTASPGPATPEANSDSLPNDYVVVDEVPDVESEEIQNLQRQTSGFAGYLEYIPSMPTIQLSSYLPGWLYPATETDSGTSANTELNESNKNFEIWLNETIRGDYTGSIEEEQRFRACLITAISEHFIRMQHIDDGFLTENCSVTNEEMCYARASKSQCARRLLLMLLHRDTRTILFFLFELSSLAKDTVENIVRSLHQHLESSFAKQAQCLRCILQERVSICLISDHLPRCDSGLLTFVNTVSEKDQPAIPSVSGRLWNILFDTVTNEVLYWKVIRMIKEAIESCGYQTDIVRMLNGDIDTGRNSFICRCDDMRRGQNGDIHESQEKREPLSMSRGAEGNSNPVDESDIAEAENNQIVANTKVETDPGHQSASGFRYENTNTRVVVYPQNNGASGYAEDMKGPKGNVDKGKTPMQHPASKRKQDQSRSNGDEILKRKPPNGSDQKSTRKRKEESSENETKEKRRRGDGGENSGTSRTVNCDLQMEMLKIVGQENQPDSGLSLPSTSSNGDSGVYEQSTMYSEGECDDETVPKQIAVDLSLSAFHTSNDQDTEGQAVEDTSGNEYASDISAPMHQESVSNLCNMEDRFEEMSDASHEQDN
ncbi:uncharacterized protein LOC123529538 [Mercenaria mercenaria]|uniref:uncharacterized protein LOC123529538 n=1 Tax=Mercenaria mercenaria TaxID=6596 RepID=UPI00234FA1AE|nr:uncharacterized protein LOC123529538 [Mercenaria mercenaria]